MTQNIAAAVCTVHADSSTNVISDKHGIERFDGCIYRRSASLAKEVSYIDWLENAAFDRRVNVTGTRISSWPEYLLSG
jgi:hypothetical protein